MERVSDRRALLLMTSVAATCALFGGLFVLAPEIALLTVNAAAERVVEIFRVDLTKFEPVPRPVDERISGLPRPASVQDLLEREAPRTAPDFIEPVATPTPNVSERLASDPIGRIYDLAPNEAMIRTADTKIVEISQEQARAGIDIARRLVKPSPERRLIEGDLPSLRGPDSGPALNTAASLPPVFGAITPEELSEAAGGAPERPPFEEGVLGFEGVEPAAASLPKLDFEDIAPQEIVQRQIETERPYAFIDDLVEVHLDTYVPPGETTGYFRVRIAPRKDREIAPLAKDVTFVIDASKSIMQRKLDLTSRGVEKCIASLRPDDRFNVAIFRETPTMFRPELSAASDETKAQAQAFVRELESRGETDVYAGIEPVIESPPRSGLPGIVVAVTDGRSTTGAMSAREIINSLTATNTHRTSIYALGGGNSVDRYLLDLLAYRNKGESRVVELDRIDEELPKFFARLQDPIMVGLDADYGGLDEKGIFPRELPDFYRGQEVQVYGTFTPDADGEFVMRIAGQAGAGRKELVFKANLKDAATTDDSIARGWAFQKSYFLIGEASRIGDDPGLVAELRRLSEKFGVRTIYSN